MSSMTLSGMVGSADNVTQAFLNQTYPAIASAVGTPVHLAAILYWALFGYRIYAGHAPLAWRDFLAKAVLTAAGSGTLNWSGFAGSIYNAFVSFMEGAAATIMAGQPTANMLDALFQNVSAVANALLKADFYQLAMIQAGVILFLVNCILFVVALFYMTIAKFGLAITMVLLPIFSAFFLFEQTRQWGMNWLNTMLTSSIMYILVVAIVRFGFLAFGDAFDAAGRIAQDASVVKAAADTALVSADIFQLVVVEGILILFMLGVRGWAAALASGAAASTGVLMMVVRSVIAKGAGR